MNNIFEQMLMSRLRNMPGYNEAMKQIEEAGGDPQKAFEIQAKKRNMNPDQLFNQLNPQGFLNNLR